MCNAHDCVRSHHGASVPVSDTACGDCSEVGWKTKILADEPECFSALFFPDKIRYDQKDSGEQPCDRACQTDCPVTERI